MSGGGRRGAVPLFLCTLLLTLAASEVQARDHCYTQRGDWRSDGAINLYNTLLWTGSTLGVRLGGDTAERVGDAATIDRKIRNGLRLGSAKQRLSADRASDAMIGIAATLPLIGVAKTWWEGDCGQAYEMFTEATEALTLVIFLTDLTKKVAGIERPFGEECDMTPPPSDARCGGNDRFKSFFSGHAAIAATGAGLACSFGLKRGTWGDGSHSWVLPCLFGSSVALATGILRLSADRHWASDVVTGFAVGSLVGYLPNRGPFDLLRIGRDDGSGMQGIVMPYTTTGANGGSEFGARLHLIY